MFDRFCFEDGVFQIVQFTNIKKKIPLSCFYLQLKFDNRELNCQPQILVWNIAEKDLVSSEVWSWFSRNLLIDWIESCINNSSTPNKEIFFSVKAK